MAVKKRVRFGGGGHIDISLLFDSISDALKDAIVEELDPVMGKMVERAKSKVNVGTVRRGVYMSGKHAGKSWTSRDPGRLRDSIRKAVHRRNDKTAVIGFFEAGDHDAYYALMHEMENPYFKQAFNAYRGAAMAAVSQALSKVTE